MKKVSFLSIAFLLLVAGCFSAKPHFPAGYFDNRYRAFIGSEQVIRSHYTWVRTLSKDGLFIQRTFYPDNKRMLSEEYFKNRQFFIKSGPARYWNEQTGDLSLEGQYENNKKEGVWKSYSDGQLVSEGHYSKGKKIGTWKEFEDGKLISRLTFDDDLRNGKFIQYDSIGGVINQGVYKADTIFEQSNPPPNRKDVVEFMPSLIPCPEPVVNFGKLDPCTEKMILEDIYENIEYPAVAREYGVEGRALVRFVVGLDGHVEDIEVLRGLCDPIKDELIRLFTGMDKRLVWRPGMQEGVKVRVQYVLPVSFQLR